MLGLIFKEYFFFRQRIPIFLYVFFIHFRSLENPIIDKVIYYIQAIIAVVFAYTFMGFILKIPFRQVIPFRWTYYGIVHWCMFFLVYYQIGTRKNMTKLKSFTLASLATVGCGWLYEVCYFHPESMFVSRYSIFYLSGQIVCLLLLLYELRRMKLKPNKKIWATLFLFLIFSGLLVYARSEMMPLTMFFRKNLWMYRTPASLLLIALLGGISKRDAKCY